MTRRAVTMLLADPEWAHWSDTEIARRVGWDQRRIGEIRHSMNAIHTDSVSIGERRTFVHPKTGAPTTMSTGNIGRGNGKREGYESAATRAAQIRRRTDPAEA